MGLTKSWILTDETWVGKAIAKNGDRPALNGVLCKDGTLAATDGFRLHVAPNGSGLSEGLWSLKRELIAAAFPDYSKIVPERDDLIAFDVDAVQDALAMAYGAKTAKSISVFDWAHMVKVTNRDGRVSYFQPQFLFEALNGFVLPNGSTDAVIAQLDPAPKHSAELGGRLTLWGLQGKRMAIVMNVRVSDDVAKKISWSLDPCLSPVTAKAIPVEVAVMPDPVPMEGAPAVGAFSIEQEDADGQQETESDQALAEADGAEAHVEVAELQAGKPVASPPTIPAQVWTDLRVLTERIEYFLAGISEIPVGIDAEFDRTISYLSAAIDTTTPTAANAPEAA